MIVSVPIPKAGETFDLDTDDVLQNLPDIALVELIKRGAKDLLNSMGMSKMKSVKNMEGKEKEEMVAAIMAQVTKNWENIKEGKIRVIGGKAKMAKAAREEIAEAKRLAIIEMKDKVRAAGVQKVSKVKSSEWTRLAKELLEDPKYGPHYIAKAKASLKAKEEGGGIDLSSVLSQVKEDPELVKKATVKNEKTKKPGVVTQSRQERPQHAGH